MNNANLTIPRVDGKAERPKNINAPMLDLA
jgi:hypothetical protein